MMYTHVLFDLDGTLTDPKIGITKSIQYALSKFGIIVNDLDSLVTFIGPPLQVSFREQFSFSDHDSKQAIAYYREYFSERGIYENEIFSGIQELLEQLVSQKKTLMVATSKPTLYAEKIVNYFNMDRYFLKVHGSELDGTRSDKTELIQFIMEEHDMQKPSVIMIGDRKHDIIGARNNGIDSIGVRYGYGSEEELQEAQTTYMVSEVADILKVLS